MTGSRAQRRRSRWGTLAAAVALWLVAVVCTAALTVWVIGRAGQEVTRPSALGLLPTEGEAVAARTPARSAASGTPAADDGPTARSASTPDGTQGASPAEQTGAGPGEAGAVVSAQAAVASTGVVPSTTPATASTSADAPAVRSGSPPRSTTSTGAALPVRPSTDQPGAASASPRAAAVASSSADRAADPRGVPTASAATPRAAVGSPSPSTPSGTQPPVASGEADPASDSVRSAAARTAGGTVSVTCRGTDLVSWRVLPRDGWSAADPVAEPGGRRFGFLRGTRSIGVHVTCAAGTQPSLRVDDSG